MKKTLFAAIAALVSMLSVFSFAAQAQQSNETIEAGKDGKFHLGKQARFGDKMLEAGMYQVRHADVNGEHVVIFRAVEMGYRNNMGNEKLGAEVARVRCAVEAIDRKAGSTKVVIRKSAAGEREVFEVWIRGEKFKHILPTS